MPLDYITLAQSRLANQFTEKPLIKALTGAMVTPMYDAEVLAEALKNERWISSAVGVQLDGCGYIVRESRKGRNDDDYRAAILFRIFINTSNATPQDLIYGLRYLTSPDDIQYIEQYPATVMLFTDGAEIQQDIKQVMQDLAPAAICDVPIMVSFSNKAPFRFGKFPRNNQLSVGTGTRLTGNSQRISITPVDINSGRSRLGGVSPAFLKVNSSRLNVGIGRLRINSPNFDIIIESGYHLTGVYQ